MREFLDKLGALLLLVVILVIVGGALLWWPIYKYHDCKRVGHSTLYCVMDVGH